MKLIPLILLTSLLGPAVASAALLSVVTRSSYRSLADSPWRDAITAGEALKHVPYECGVPGMPFTCYNPATTLADGLGFLDNFEDDDDISPFVQVDVKEISSSFFDESFGIFNSHQLTSGILPGNQGVLPMTFVATEDGKYPTWLGFAIIPQHPDEVLQVLGVSGWVENINLYDITNTMPPREFEAYRFVGFIFDSPVKSATIYGSGSIIDHLQYGYGAGPVPEPGTVMLGTAGALLLARRRRRMGKL